MSDDKMHDRSDYYLVIGPIQKGLDGYPATDRKEWLEDAGWQDVQIIWASLNEHIHYKVAYQAGRKAERETIRKLMSPQVVAPLIKLSECVNEALKRNKSEGE